MLYICLFSRVLLTVATEESYRGQIVQAGGVKVSRSNINSEVLPH